MSQIFGVSTDYLLKDEFGEPEYTETKNAPAAEETPLRRVSMEEAASFLEVKKQTAPKIALAVFLCIVSPIVLILMDGLSGEGLIAMSENAAGAIGMITLFILVAIAVALFIICGAKTEKYEYLEKEPIELEYGVSGMVKERQNRMSEAHTRDTVLGICLCVLSAVPIFAGMFSENKAYAVIGICGLLFMVACGVLVLIRSGILWESTQKLLQEGDYTVAEKEMSKKIAPIVSAYLAHRDRGLPCVELLDRRLGQNLDRLARRRSAFRRSHGHCEHRQKAEMILGEQKRSPAAPDFFLLSEKAQSLINSYNVGKKLP